MTARLRPLNQPARVEVRTDGEGRPLALRTRRGQPLEEISQIRESWRIDDEWWRRPVSREYHQVVLENGKVATLYLDLAEGGWYLQGGGG
ncbi:MAG: hypothetical protein WD960_06485 [Gemmatimonadota bacterium]